MSTISDRNLPSAAARVSAHLRAVHELDQRTHAVEWFDDERAMLDAKAVDDAGDTIAAGALRGLPITVKDWIDVAGFPCAGGAAAAAERRPARDATVVARLRAAGAVVLAKTKPWDGFRPDAPPVLHPIDPLRFPGGSSTGEGVVTAAGGSPLGLGSDSGGSIRVPAAWCGVYGLKPTTGRIPGTGHFPRIGMKSDGRTTIGFLASDLDLIEAATRATAGPDGLDAGALPVPFTPSPRGPLAGLRVAQLAPDPDWPATAAVADACTRAVVALEESGMTRAAWDWPWLPEAVEITAGYWQRTTRSGEAAAEQLWGWDRFQRRFLVATAEVDILVSPVTATVAPLRTSVAARDRTRTDGLPTLVEDFVFTLPASLTGSPAISVPMGDDPATGLPLAVQLIGRPWEDHIVLAAARTLAPARAAAPPASRG